MWAGVVSEKENIPIDEIEAIAKKHGFVLVGSKLQEFEREEMPDEVALWIMYGVDRIELDPCLPCKFIRLACLKLTADKTVFCVTASPWYIILYYHALMYLRRWQVSLENKKL